jgi:diguanylate cyclase (GGDEF)-like protein
MKRIGFSQYPEGDIPDFLIKTTLGCSLIVVILLVPFTTNNFIQGRYILGLGTLSVTLACIYNVWNGYNGRYSLLVNSWVLTPTAVFSATYAMVKLGYTGSYWPFLLALSSYFVLPPRRALSINLIILLTTIPASFLVLDLPAAVRLSSVLIGVSLFAYFSMREIDTLHVRLKEQAVTDKLTGLFNRSLLRGSLRQAIARHKRSGVPMVLIAFDIDHFKSINDTFGHDIGDSVLRQLGYLLKQFTRESDMVFRAGGEEFLVLVHNTDARQGLEVGEKLRQEVENARLLTERKVTISVGVSELRMEMDEELWLKACDEKLYKAKEDGRNRVV